LVNDIYRTVAQRGAIRRSPWFKSPGMEYQRGW